MLENESYLQNGDKECIPELLLANKVVAVTVEFTSLKAVTVGETDENPHKDDSTPTSKTMMAFKEAINDL